VAPCPGVRTPLNLLRDTADLVRMTMSARIAIGGPKRVGVVVAAGVVASLAVAGGFAAAALRSLGHIPDGRSTATITWTGKTGLRPTISAVGGSVEQYRVKGSGTLPNYFDQQGLTTTPSGTTATLATIHGTLDGTLFTITISITAGSPAAQHAHSFASVTGTFHGVPVSATIYVPATTQQLQKDLGTFVGTIGSQQVKGTILKPTSSHGRNTAHAVFDVSN